EQAWCKKYKRPIDSQINTIIPHARCRTLMYVGKYSGSIRQESVIILTKRPVHKCGASNDILTWHVAPVARVGTSPTIVAHYKIIIGWDDARDRLVWIRNALVAGSNITLFQRDAIHNYGSATDADPISWNGNNALNIIL